LFLLICLGGPPVNLAAHKSAPVTEYRRLVYDVTVLIRKHTAHSDCLETALYRVQTIGVWHHSTDSKAYSDWLETALYRRLVYDITVL